MNQEDTYKLVQDYASRGVPLDVYVYDMDWHVKPQWEGMNGTRVCSRTRQTISRGCTGSSSPC